MKEYHFRQIETHLNQVEITHKERHSILSYTAGLVDQQPLPPLRALLLKKWRLPTYVWLISLIFGFIIGWFL